MRRNICMNIATLTKKCTFNLLGMGIYLTYEELLIEADYHVPVVLTNKHFTKSAIELAQKTHVLLWDREKLDEMIANLSSKQNI